ncbi:MAG: hypothetical protein ABID38_04845 [Candidatus Diapherotrites archaeon]
MKKASILLCFLLLAAAGCLSEEIPQTGEDQKLVLSANEMKSLGMDFSGEALVEKTSDPGGGTTVRVEFTGEASGLVYRIREIPPEMGLDETEGIVWNSQNIALDSMLGSEKMGDETKNNIINQGSRTRIVENDFLRLFLSVFTSEDKVVSVLHYKPKPFEEQEHVAVCGAIISKIESA